MHALAAKYETAIRLGLVAIVVLLLLLNISSSYTLYRAKRQLTASIDNRLGGALALARMHIVKNGSMVLAGDQRDLIARQFNVDHIDLITASRLTSPGPEGALSQLAHSASADPNINLGIREAEFLLAGRMLYRTEHDAASRIGLAAAEVGIGRTILLRAAVPAPELAIISGAARQAMILAVVFLAFVLPLTIGLPRLILHPFRRMKAAAQSAGQWPGGTPDEVSEVIRSYEETIAELTRNRAQLERLYRESTHRAERLEKLNRYILASIRSGLIFIDPAGKVTQCNHAAGEFLGTAEPDLIGRHYLSIFQDDPGLALMVEAGLVRGESSRPREIELQRAGTGVRLGAESSQIFDDNGRVVGLSLLLTDLTEIKRLHGELETNRRLAALGEMSGGLAHQLRNSLAAISGFARLLTRKARDIQPIAGIAESIRKESGDAATMLNRFLVFARPLCLAEEKFRLDSLWQKIIDNYRAEIERRGIRVEMRFLTPAPIVTGDPLLLKEAFSNVFDNAVQAVADGGRIEVTAAGDRGHLVLTVADNGPGIPPDLQSRIFTPFVSSKPSGTGLGLALARKIMSLHGGQIGFDPVQKTGAVCRIFLPGRLAITEQSRSDDVLTFKNQ